MADTWDRQIRQQIHDCRLFIAMISAHTEARDARVTSVANGDWRSNVPATVANALLLQHHYDEALAELEREPDEGTRHAGRALVFHALGRHSESDFELQSFLSYLETAQIPWYSEVARIHAFRGERDRAMEFLEKAYQKRDCRSVLHHGRPSS